MRFNFTILLVVWALALGAHAQNRRPPVPSPSGCPPGMLFDKATKTCLKVVPKCAQGQVFDQTKKACVSARTLPPVVKPLQKPGN